ncbi:hypothetical protein K435DRAFT_867911 [Dendrothele bispora CBS 962.96]|uniref:Uncharacterized protein n=1 Tax=Dendrothele bispora (strain CBS 962.96) TaxID=1314807 RepID=A0A4S8LD61_DENBC|nr:hypothetical protein K435DRAFT_867911 [Dendrothele bispora CBS 962.96]
MTAQRLRKSPATTASISRFICPPCEHSSKGAPDIKLSEFVYHGFYDSNGAPIPKVLLEIRNRQFTWFKPLKLERLAIVQLQVAGIAQDLEIPYQIAVLKASAYASGVVSVSEVLGHELRSPETDNPDLPCCPQPLLISKIVFDLATEDGVSEYGREMVNLRHAINSMGITRVVFFVVSHSDPEIGDLHFAPGGAGAERLEIVMKALFSPATTEWLRPKETYLFTLVCGSKPITADGYRHLQTYVTSRFFENIFLFPTNNLQPLELTSFITNLLDHVLFRHEPIGTMIPVVLKELSTLGLHTRILHLGLRTDSRGRWISYADRYVWTQRTRRPWGLDAPAFCPQCNTIKSFRGVERLEGPDGKLVVQFKCHGANCRAAVTVPLTSAEYKLVRGPREPCGGWQQHDFQWNEELLGRF